MTIPFQKTEPKPFHWFIVLILLAGNASAQTYDDLNQLPGHQAQVYFSTGASVKAIRMAEQLDRVFSFYKERLHFSPTVTLLVLSPADWSKYTNFPVYGMPHYSDKQTLVVASENNDFWKSFIPPADKIPAEYTDLIRQSYTDANGNLTMEPFFDLLAIHELGHAYHIQGGLVMQRKWMGELFSNILLHSYIAVKEPQLLNALTTFPKLVVATTSKSSLRYTTLNELEDHYVELGQLYPQNYGWYQCRWHMAAADIYDQAGLVALENLWTSLKAQTSILDDPSFLTLLSNQVHQSVADVPLKWEE